MIVYRLVHPRHSRTAFTGEGAYLAGGRWNSPGVRVVYTSSSIALAVPSVLAPPEYNILLNCAHPDFAHLRISGPEGFPFNPRLTPDA